MTSYRWDTLKIGGRPERGSSCNPSGPAALNRVRHFFTVLTLTSRSSATLAAVAPSASCKMIDARRCRRCSARCPFAHAISFSRCSTTTSNRAGRRVAPPAPAPAATHASQHERRGTDCPALFSVAQCWKRLPERATPSRAGSSFLLLRAELGGDLLRHLRGIRQYGHPIRFHF